MPNVSTSTSKNPAVSFDEAVRAIAQSDLPDDQRALLATILEIGHDHQGTHRFVTAMAASATRISAPQERNDPSIMLKEWLESWTTRYTGVPVMATDRSVELILSRRWETAHCTKSRLRIFGLLLTIVAEVRQRRRIFTPACAERCSVQLRKRSLTPIHQSMYASRSSTPRGLAY